MKKTLAVSAIIAFAVGAYANVWNVDWSLGSGYAESPDSSEHGALEDYSVTWSLMYGDTVIDSITAAAGSSGIGWADTYKPTFSQWLDEPSDYVTYYGSTLETAEVQVYQKIFLDNGTDQYTWQSESVPVKPVSEVTDPAKGWDVIIHSSDWIKSTDPTGVPEPATMSLLGLGALAMALRRKLRK